MLGRPVGWAVKAFHQRSGAEAAALDDAATTSSPVMPKPTPR
jgi:hypothetical protein